MDRFKSILLAFSIICSLYLVMWGFKGQLPSWIGGLAWLFLLIGHVMELLNVSFLKAGNQQDEWVLKELKAVVGELKENQCKRD